MSPHPLRLRAAAAASAVTLLLALGACVQSTPDVATSTQRVTHAQNARVPEGAAWTQHYFPSSDGSDVELHSDVLRPVGLGATEKVPVILSVGPYFGHSGELKVDGFDHTGPSDRFADLIQGTDLFDRGYALVTVDLRGFGGSTGGPDFMGAGEQADVRAAIDWAAGQPWSTGAVGMYGKSYDAITGLVGNNLDQDALKAVVAQEPLWDLARNIRSNGVPRTTTVDVPRSYTEIAKLPQPDDDDAHYRANASWEDAHPESELLYKAGYQTADPRSPYWKARDLAAQAKGTDTPLLVTQGFLEANSEPEAVEEYLANHTGPERGWLGPWEHKRGNDRDTDGRLAMGREGWFEEVISFYDEYLKGVEPSTSYPAYAIQDNTGSWRSQGTWPAPDSSTSIGLGGGSYLDDGAEGDPGVESGNGFVRWSEPVTRATRITGTPRISLGVQGHGNIHVRLHDVAPDGTAVLFDEQVAAVSSGPAAFDLKSVDQTLAPGHVVAVEIGTIEAGPLSDWLDTPSRTTLEISGATLELDLQDPADDLATQGGRAPYLDIYLSFSSQKMPVGTPSFTVPSARD
jgi:predicted acyl esterase